MKKTKKQIKLEKETAKIIAQLKKERIARGENPYSAFNDGSIDKDKYRRS